MNNQSSVISAQSSVLKLRSGQSEFVDGVERYGVCALVARRQYGKTTLFSTIALKKMMKRKNHTVVFGSAKLNLAREMVRKEADVIQRAIQAARVLQVADGETGKIPDKLTADDFASLYEAQRLEFRYYHSRTVYSRTKVVALGPDTVGETGDLMCDEIGRVSNWKETYGAIEPIVSSDPTFRLTLCTTPPPDDMHYSFEMLMPPLGTEFPVNPKGNWYRSETGIMVLRVTAFDAYADGVSVYDLETREPLTPQAHRERHFDKTVWDREYGCGFIFGGTAACGLVQLDAAMRRGIGQCACFQIDDDADMDRAIAFLVEHLGAGPVGIGVDLATTEKETSNPTAVSVNEQRGLETIVRTVFVWKTQEPDIARARIRSIVLAIKERKEGGRARRLCVDATNERYFAIDLRNFLGGEVPVELVIGSETIEVPGHPEPMTMKQYLGSTLVDELDANHLTLPPERYIKEDFRLVKRDRGSFDAEISDEGRHGDTFDSTKLGLRAITSTAGGILSVEGIRLGYNPTRFGTFVPARLGGRL